jgi:uncharacterized protein (DUF58 family)
VNNFSALQHEADGLSAGLPPLMVEADHLAASVSLGVHGRRRAGIGETFWQFRRYGQSDSAAAIDWRQSAKSQHIFVREREWEAAQTVWFWRDASPGMQFQSGPKGSGVSKRARADLLLLALASLLVRGGERVGYLGMDGGPAASRLALSRVGRALFGQGDQALPPHTPLSRGNQLVWFSDFLDDGVEAAAAALSQQGVEGHLVQIVDPAEEDFPYSGRTRFESPRGDGDEIFGRAERIRGSYRARFAAHRERIAAMAARLRWTCTLHRTDHPAQASLIALHAAIGGG